MIVTGSGLLIWHVPSNEGFGFEAHPELRAWCAENGYPAPNQQRYIMEGYIDWAVKRSANLNCLVTDKS